MLAKIGFFTLLFSFQCMVRAQTPDTQIKQLFVILGNSPRAPLVVYPSDTYNETYWKTRFGGLGQITPAGMLDSYKLGQYIKNYYSQFLTPSYVRDRVYARSIDEDASLQSLNTYLAGIQALHCKK